MYFTINDIAAIKEDLGAAKLVSYKLSGSNYVHQCNCKLCADMAFDKVGTDKSLVTHMLLNDNVLVLIYGDNTKCIYTLDISLGQSLRFIMLGCDIQFYNLPHYDKVALVQERLANDSRFIKPLRDVISDGDEL